MTRGAAKGTLQLAAEQVVLLFTGYFATLLLARGLGPEAFGLYGLVLSVLGWAEYSGQFGLPSATTRLIAEGREDEEAVGQTTVALGLILFSVVFAVFFLAAPFIAGALRVPGESWLFRLAAIDIPLYGTYFLLRGVGLGRRKYGRLAAAGVVSAVVKLAGALVLWRVGFSVARALVVVILGSSAGLLILVWGVSFRLMRPDRRITASLVHLSIPLALAAFGLSLMHTLHLWILKAASGEGMESLVGIYVAAAHIAKAPEMVVIAVGAVLFPSIARAMADESHAEALAYVHGALRFLALVLLPTSILVCLDAEKIMTFFFSSKYAGGGAILGIQILGYSSLALLVTFMTILLARGEFVRGVGICLLSLLVMLISGLALVPGKGAVGAASALLAASAVGAVVSGALVRHRFGGLILPRTLLRAVLATAVVTAASVVLRGEGLLLLPKYAGLAVVYVGALAGMGELKKKDFVALRFWR